jgi:hypothetical protein
MILEGACFCGLLSFPPQFRDGSWTVRGLWVAMLVWRATIPRAAPDVRTATQGKVSGGQVQP